MQLERIYYTFPITQGVDLLVEVTDGDPVEYGSRSLPFTADGELAVGDSRQFDKTFVLHVSGRSVVEVGHPAPEPLVVEQLEPPGAPPQNGDGSPVDEEPPET